MVIFYIYSITFTSDNTFQFQRKFPDRASRDEHGGTCARRYPDLKGSSGTEVENRFHLTQQALTSTAELYRLVFERSDTFQIEKLKTALIKEAYETLTKKIENDMEKNFKYFVSFFLEFYLASDVSVVTDPPVVFRSEPFQIHGGMDYEHLLLQLEQIYNNIVLKIELFCVRGSGYVISKFVKLEISTILHDPIRTGSYITTPKKFANGKCGLLNIKNNDQKCLLYALVAWDQRRRGVVPARNATHVHHYINLADTSKWIFDG